MEVLDDEYDLELEYFVSPTLKLDWVFRLLLLLLLLSSNIIIILDRVVLLLVPVLFVIPIDLLVFQGSLLVRVVVPLAYGTLILVLPKQVVVHLEFSLVACVFQCLAKGDFMIVWHRTVLALA